MSSYDFLKKYFSKTPPAKHQPIFLTATPAPVSDIYALRSEQEDALYSALREGGRHILLYGPGGSGKTHLARKLFYRLCEDYERLAWVEYGADLRTALTAPPDENCVENLDVLFDRGIQALEESPEKTILFIDDAKENAMDDDTLAQVTGMGVTVFLTSRCKRISPYETWEIAPITITDCVNLFYANYHYDSQRKHQKIVRKLVSQLECNVFAVLLLAKIVGELDNLPRIAKQLQKGSLMDHIGQLLNLADLSSDELFVLQCFALMPSGESHKDVCEWFDFDPEIANLLCDKGWLDKTNEANCYILHDLVREYLNKTGLPPKVYKLFLSAFLKNETFISSNAEEDIIYKLTAVQSALKKVPKNTALYILTLLRMSMFRRNRGQYQLALNYTLDALESATQIENLPPDFLNRVHWELAINYGDCALYSQALEYYHLCESYQENIPESDNLILARLWNNIGTCYSEMDDQQEALNYYQKSIIIKEEHQGIYHNDTAGTYNNIGNSHGALGNYEEALKYQQKALSILEQLGKDPLHIASTHDNIGITYSNLGEYKKALNHHEIALETRKRMLGKSHPKTAITYYNLGSIYDKLNNPDKCIHFSFTAYEVFSKMLGSEHSRTQQARKALQEYFSKYHSDQDFSAWLNQQTTSIC